MDKPVFQIADPAEVVARILELKYRSSELKSRLAPILKKLWNPTRELRAATNLSGFADLRTRFPNFGEAIDIFEANAIGLARVGEPYEAQPVLLVGEPGLGKTLFVSELAKVLGLPNFEISMSTVSASFALSGGSLQWEGGDVGFVAKSLAESDDDGNSVGNPIFLIDEIDKCNLGAQYNPISSFYSLLERHTASRFVDEALGIKLNASRVIWIATANSIHNIPDAIMSRLRVIEISRPDAGAMPAVINSVYKSLRRDRAYGKLLQDDLDEDVINALSGKVPREIRQTLEDGILKAIMAGRDYISVNDLPAFKERRRVGF